MLKNISWDECFMQLAEVIAKRSKDPSTKVGAIIVKNNAILGMGYNGHPRTYSDLDNDLICSWERPEKYDTIVHAEMNAILNAKCDLKDATLYVTMFPCLDCAKHVITSGIKIIYYINDKYYDQELYKKSRELLNKYKIKLVKMEGAC